MSIDSVKIDLKEVPAAGGVQVIMRCRPHDKNTVDKAAKLLDMTQAEFMRVTAVQAARKVIAAEEV